MARMILKAVHSDSERRKWPLSERVLDENLGRYHHVEQSPEHEHRIGGPPKFARSAANQSNETHT